MEIQIYKKAGDIIKALGENRDEQGKRDNDINGQIIYEMLIRGINHSSRNKLLSINTALYSYKKDPTGKETKRFMESAGVASEKFKKEMDILLNTNLKDLKVRKHGDKYIIDLDSMLKEAEK